MREYFKKIVLYLFVGIFFFCFLSLDVRADEDILWDEVLNDYSDIVFRDNSIAIIKGSLRGNLVLEKVTDQIKIEELKEIYGINDISILDDKGLELEDDSIVVSGMDLKFSGDDFIITYKIMVVGDVDNNGIINNDDVTNMVDSVLNNGSVGIINDVNDDGVFDVYDITHMIYSITNDSWDNLGVVSDNLVSEFISPAKVYVGDEIEVKYIIHGFKLDSINGIEGLINYDNNLLELVSTDIDSEYGYINSDNKFLYILGNYTGNDALLTLRFKALKEGNSIISIENIKASMNGLAVNIDRPSISTSVEINSYGLGGDDTYDDSVSSNKNIENIKVEYPASSSNNSVVAKVNYSSEKMILPSTNNSNIVSYVSISNDNYIKELNIKDYKIDFDKDTLEYSITVSSKVSSLDLDIILSDDKASYEVSGNEKFKTGRNVVTITVTAEDGSTRVYTINVNKENVKDVAGDEETSNSSRVVIIILIILVIIGLIYVIFKDDEEEERENNDKESKN